MLYYGDRARRAAPSAVLGRVEARLARARALTGEEREAELVAALVECGELAQGLADHAFEATGQDDDDPVANAALGLTLDVAHAWLSADAPVGADRRPDARRLDRAALPAAIRIRVPEGYAHYALDPALHVEAARRMRAAHAPDDRWFVIGLRSIGTSLAAVAAAACGTRDVVTLRPVGHPYRRELRVATALARRVRDAAAARARFAIVDEGPGLSGSSFACVAEWLAASGVDPGRIALLPAHLGPLGPAASPERRAWWAGAERFVARFEEVVLPRLGASVERSFGAGSMEDVGGGRWRAAFGRTGATAPPVFRTQERRKYLALGDRGALVVRFAGVGPYAERAFERARALADAGWAPPARRVSPGFVATEVARAVGASRGGLPSRAELLGYLAHRARTLPPIDDGDGATEEQLLELVRVNAAEALGPEAARGVDRLAAGARRAAALPRVAVDGKLEWWEWTRSPRGRSWKLDATDHAVGHDLVGCQPATWDVAGARIELGLSWPAAIELAARIVPGATAEVLAFHEAAYLAHRIGRWTFALQQEGDPAERARIERALSRYRARLRRRL